MTAQSDILAANEAVTVATDSLITVIVYNTSPLRVSCSALGLACRWVQNQLFDTKFMMAAKRLVRYTCTIRLVRDCKLNKTTGRVWRSRNISVFWGFFDAVRSLRQLMICSTSHRQRGVCLLLLPVAGAILACVLLYFFRAFFCLFVFAFYGVLCGNCNWSILSFFFFSFFFSFFLSFFPHLSFFCCFAENYGA